MVLHNPCLWTLCSSSISLSLHTTRSFSSPSAWLVPVLGGPWLAIFVLPHQNFPILPTLVYKIFIGVACFLLSSLLQLYFSPFHVLLLLIPTFSSYSPLFFSPYPRSFSVSLLSFSFSFSPTIFFLSCATGNPCSLPKKPQSLSQWHTHTHTYIYIYILERYMALMSQRFMEDLILSVSTISHAVYLRGELWSLHQLM